MKGVFLRIPQSNYCANVSWLGSSALRELYHHMPLLLTSLSVLPQQPCGYGSTSTRHMSSSLDDSQRM